MTTPVAGLNPISADVIRSLVATVDPVIVGKNPERAAKWAKELCDLASAASPEEAIASSGSENLATHWHLV